MTQAQLHIAQTGQALQESAAAFVLRVAVHSLAARGRFTIAFSGGSLPSLVCPPLLTDPLVGQIAWSAWRIFFVDERCVPLDDAESNYRLLRDQLLDHAPIPAAHVFPARAELPPQEMADAYDSLLRHTLERGSEGWPVFDLILLGMGPDGHTASLFPNHALLHETQRCAAAIFDAPKPPPQRITLTLPVINQARYVAFIVAGESKAAAVAYTLQPPVAIAPTPARLVQPVSGELHWFLDEAAARQLDQANDRENAPVI